MSEAARHATHAFITCFDAVYAPATLVIASGCASHHDLPASKPSDVTRSIHVPRFAGHAMPAIDAIVTIAEPAVIFGTSDSIRCRAPTKLTSMTSRSENGGPGRPAHEKRASTGASRATTAASIEAWSRRSTSSATLTGAVTGLTSSVVTSAPRSRRMPTVAAPIPVAAPATTTRLPS